jgi:hypothetical protein
MKTTWRPNRLKAAYRKPECKIVELQSAGAVLAGSMTPPPSGSGLESWGEEDLDDE